LLYVSLLRPPPHLLLPSPTRYVPSHKLPALIAEAAIGKMEQFSAQNLSNMLWSFVYLHYRNEDLLRAAAEQVRRP
jgi:hypothetical protein